MSQQLLTQFDENKERKRNDRRQTARVLHNRMKTVEGKEKKLENSENQVNRLFKCLSTSTVQIEVLIVAAHSIVAFIRKRMKFLHLVL